MHFLKQVVGVLATPLMLVVVLCAIGWLLARLRWRRSATVVFVLTGLFAYFSTTGLMAKVMMTPLENAYAPQQDASLPAVRYVVVLGSSYQPRKGVSVTASLDYDGLARLVEAVRLVRKLPGAQLVLPGAVRGAVTPTGGYARLARDLGLPDSALVLIDAPALDTASEARQVAEYLGANPFLLITSATHMHRAVALMKRAGARPIPAPATRPTEPFSAWDLVPQSRGLRATELAIHEYMGLAAMAAGLD